jgi:A/G-specific adenine glycosylase
MPWRRNRDPYSVWLSEIIFQQTRIDQGTPYYERFIAAFPDVEALASAPDDAVLKLWEGLGYYTRARNLHKAARVIVHERASRLPETAAEWEQLPGVGRYTAGAIASIAFGERVPVLDGNVKRVLSRLYDIADNIDDAATLDRLWSLADDLTPQRAPGDFNQAIMELGARICAPKIPLCETCPVRTRCQARAAGTQHQRPVRRAKKAVPHYEIVIAAIRKNGRYLVGKRPASGLLGGLWEFPGGKVHSGETHECALRRAAIEEIGVEVKVGGLVASVNHAYSHFRVTVNVYRCEALSGTPKARTHTELKWVAPSQFDRYAFPKVNHKFLALLA